MSLILSDSKPIARILSARGAIAVFNKPDSLGRRDGKNPRAALARCWSGSACVGNPRARSFPASWLGNAQRKSFPHRGNGEEGDVASKTLEERRVIGYSSEQIFQVVAAVDLYEDFLPWCQRSKIRRRYADGSFDAELEIGFKFLSESYVSHVVLKKSEYIKTTASEGGPFGHLINIWEFNPGPVPGSCNVHFLVDFNFHSPIYRQVAFFSLNEAFSRIVHSFSDRCRQIYGPGVQVH